jgi:hypothetical protein
MRRMPQPDLSRAVWRKSTRSGNGPDCVEIAAAENTIAVRDSKNPDGPSLGFGRTTWRHFSSHVKSGTYDR